MSFFPASVIFLSGLIAFMVLLPVGIELIPGIEDTMGPTVGIMISAMFVIILVTGFMLYIKQAQEPDEYGGGFN
jgi:predicted histidine transporter YuiF (NhaC family)